MHDNPLPFLTAEVPGIGGIIRATADDFMVEEQPLYLPSGTGEHLYLRITKRGLATPQLVAYLSSQLGIKARSIGVAGLKDARAVSTQMVSLQGTSPEAIASLNHEKIVAVELLGWHRNRLRPGHHAGNRFRIVVREVRASASDVVPTVLDQLTQRGVPNYFGPQRQGKTGRNYQVGHDVLKDGLQRARLPKHKRTWYLNAYQAYVFNLVLASRLTRIDRILVGDWAMKHENGACFMVEDSRAEQPRADRFEISPTGPLFGSRSPWATGEPGDIEQAVVQALGETTASLKEAAVACRFRGERRPLRVCLSDLTWSLTHEGLTIFFTLPPGAYATSVLRELMKTDATGV